MRDDLGSRWRERVFTSRAAGASASRISEIVRAHVSGGQEGGGGGVGERGEGEINNRDRKGMS